MKTISLGIKIGLIWFMAEVTHHSLDGFCVGAYKAYKQRKAEQEEDHNAEKKEESAEE